MGDVAMAHVPEWLETQAQACERLGSTLYAHLLRRTAEDLRAGGPAARVLEVVAADDRSSAPALRLMAAVHRLALARKLPALALHLPSLGGTANGDAWPAFRAALVDHADELRAAITRRCQTNEVGRSAALLGGYLLLRGEHRLPLRLLEIGSSAGLNLRVDWYRFDGAGWSFGPADSPVVIAHDSDLPASLRACDLQIAQRAGCDPAPVDPTTAEGRLTLSASVWADRPDRFARLSGALQVAAHVPVTVDAESAGTWIPRQLAQPTPGVATVVVHSAVWQYVAPGDRRAVAQALERAGSAATLAAPVAWLRMEPVSHLRDMEVHLTTWPGGIERHIADAGAHGDPVRWRL